MDGLAGGGFGSILILLVVMVVFFFLMSIPARKAQKKQAEQRAAAVVVGNNVVTASGFLGRIVDIDGDAVTLESPAGDETVWLRSSIAAQMDIPFADAPEDSEEEPTSLPDMEPVAESDEELAADMNYEGDPNVDDDSREAGDAPETKREN
ncbi:MAG: preprotein translocase subunit YajC [Arcanobacterium sp.]|nr:preprotein translocase subunit YajC [Arcanobacterium sp.]